MNTANAKNWSLHGAKGLLRIGTGLALGFLIYYVAYHYASVDCQTLQTSNRSAGASSALKITSLLIVLTSLGLPSAISGILAGLLLGPSIGGPLASMAIVASSAIFWVIGHLAGRNSQVKFYVEGALTSKPWFSDAMTQRAATGFNWTIINAMNSPLSYPLFSFVVGTLIPHLTFISMISGIFATSVLYVAGYALAGGSIGCAVVNHAQGLPYEQYKTLMLASCIILLLLSKLQSHIEQKGKA